MNKTIKKLSKLFIMAALSFSLASGIKLLGADNTIEINRDYDVVLLDSVEELSDTSELVAKCKVIKQNESELINIVEDKELIKFYKEKGYSEAEYSDIWTTYVMSVEEVIQGECTDKTILYRTIGGQVGKYKQNIDEMISKNEEFMLFLNKDEETGIYYNSSFYQGQVKIVDDELQTNDAIFSDYETLEDVVSEIDKHCAKKNKADNSKADNSKANNSKADNSKADSSKADNNKADNNKVSNNKENNNKEKNNKVENEQKIKDSENNIEFSQESEEMMDDKPQTDASASDSEAMAGTVSE